MSRESLTGLLCPLDEAEPPRETSPRRCIQLNSIAPKLRTWGRGRKKVRVCLLLGVIDEIYGPGYLGTTTTTGVCLRVILRGKRHLPSHLYHTFVTVIAHLPSVEASESSLERCWPHTALHHRHFESPRQQRLTRRRRRRSHSCCLTYCLMYRLYCRCPR